MALVLIVDDEPMQRTLYRHLASALGYEVALASNAQSGFDLAQSLLPKLILTDINMPGMNGDEFLAILRQNESTKSIPVIAVTAVPKRDKIFQQKGFDGYILKPVSITWLDRIMKNVLREDSDWKHRTNTGEHPAIIWTEDDSEASDDSKE